jgi:hypothetical protein
MTREDSARYLGLKEMTLAMWALQGKGPRSIRVGGRVFWGLARLPAGALAMSTRTMGAKNDNP